MRIRRSEYFDRDFWFRTGTLAWPCSMHLQQVSKPKKMKKLGQSAFRSIFFSNAHQDYPIHFHISTIQLSSSHLQEEILVELKSQVDCHRLRKRSGLLSDSTRVLSLRLCLPTFQNLDSSCMKPKLWRIELMETIVVDLG